MNMRGVITMVHFMCQCGQVMVHSCLAKCQCLDVAVNSTDFKQITFHNVGGPH